jgi:hypothetical protein
MLVASGVAEGSVGCNADSNCEVGNRFIVD